MKLNIRPQLEEEIEELLPGSGARSKTDYINRAIANFNQAIRRKRELEKLQRYFRDYRHEAADILREFSTIRNASTD